LKFNLYVIHYCSPHLIYFENAIGKGIELRHYLGTRCERSLQKVCTWVKLSTLKMRPFQLEGLNWMIRLQEHGVNGILAGQYDMGVGVKC